MDKHKVEDEKPVRLCNYIDVYNNEYITFDLDFMEATATVEEIRRFNVEEGDVLVTKDSETWNDIAVPAYVASQLDNVLCGYHLAQVRTKRNLYDGQYLFRAFSARGINDQFRVEATGITRYGLGKYGFENAFFLVPPIREQQAIATFLDRETSRIDELIAKKERQIELLQEKRSALISHAVTKGLDPNLKMKDSGVEWLGEIPEHWEVKKVKNVVLKIGSGKTPKGGSEVYVDSGIMLIRSQNVHFDGLRLDDIAFIEPEIDAEMANTRVIPGDTLLNITGASLGRCCIMPANHDLANVNQHVCIVRPRKDIIDPHFLYFTMCSHPLQSQIFANENGTSREGLNFEQVSNLLIPFPPGIIEQQAIIGKVITNIQKMDINIAKVNRSIDLLREYRTALISAAVTGKIDLREEVPVS